MDGTQMNFYYEEQLAVLRDSVYDLGRLNWDGLFHWLSAKATWSVPPITPSQLEEVRTHVTVLLDILGPR